MNPDVLGKFFNGGLAAPTELPLDEDLDAGILGTTGLGIGFGVGLTIGAGAFLTVATDAELFKELRELLKDVLDVDLSTLRELVRRGTARLGSIGVRGGTFNSLAGTFFGISGDFRTFGTGESHSTLQPDDAPCDALSEFKLCVSSNPSSFSSCSLFTFDILGDVVLSGTLSILAFMDFL